jgi:hypothetical protein
MWFRSAIICLGEFEMRLHFRRGMARVGLVLLVIDELIVLSMFWTNESWQNRLILVGFIGVVIPIFVWMSWRTLLWVVHGFVLSDAP